jgi:hypothetical protein
MNKTRDQLWAAFDSHGTAIVQGASGNTLKRHVQARAAILHMLGIP